jgi:hypothetical protein
VGVGEPTMIHYLGTVTETLSSLESHIRWRTTQVLAAQSILSHGKTTVTPCCLDMVRPGTRYGLPTSSLVG